MRLLEFHFAQLDPGRLGLGRDEYDATSREHAAAYALYARGLARLFAATGDERWLARARSAADRLLSLTSPGTDVAWGLPFAWEAMPLGQPNSYTTSVAVLGLAELALVDRESRFAEAVAGGCEWLIERVPWEGSDAAGRGPHYAPGWAYVATNVVALAAAALERGYELTGTAALRQHAHDAVSFVLTAQADEGYWTYTDDDTAGQGRAQRIVDLVHTAYTIDGLVSVAPGLPRSQRATARDAARRGIGFMMRWLVHPGGHAREKVMVVARDDGELAQLQANPRLTVTDLSPTHVVVAFPEESRTWGYGAMLGALARASDAGVVATDLVSTPLRRVLAEQAARPSGRFPYRPADRRIFPRHEAHLFEGLAATFLAPPIESKPTPRRRISRGAVIQPAVLPAEIAHEGGERVRAAVALLHPPGTPPAEPPFRTDSESAAGALLFALLAQRIDASGPQFVALVRARQLIDDVIDGRAPGSAANVCGLAAAVLAARDPRDHERLERCWQLGAASRALEGAGPRAIRQLFAHLCVKLDLPCPSGARPELEWWQRRPPEEAVGICAALAAVSAGYLVQAAELALADDPATLEDRLLAAASLVWAGADLQSVAPVLAPVDAARLRPKQGRVHVQPGTVSWSFSRDGQRADVTLDTTDLNLLTNATIAAIRGMDSVGVARDAMSVLALGQMIPAIGQDVGEVLSAHIGGGVARLLEAQRSDGSWRSVANLGWWSDRATLTSTAATALAAWGAQSGSAAQVAAAERGFRFVDESIGTLRWNGREILSEAGIGGGTRPASPVPQAMFALACATLRAGSTDERVRSDCAERATDLLGHLNQLSLATDGISASEAAVVAHALARMDSLEHGLALEVARRLIERLAAMARPSGAVPSAAVGSVGLDLPIRATTQLHFVTACALAGTHQDAARAALGFVAACLWSRPLGEIAAGVAADGTFDDRPLASADPELPTLVLSAMPLLGWVGPQDYSPALSPVRSAPERFLSTLSEVLTLQERRARRPAAHAYHGLAALAIYRATGNGRWLGAARREAEWLQANRSGQKDARLASNPAWGPLDAEDEESGASLPTVDDTAPAGRLLAELWELTTERSYLDTAVGAATWLVEECGFESARDGAIEFYTHSRSASADEKRATSAVASARAVAMLAAVWALSPDAARDDLLAQALRPILSSRVRPDITASDLEALLALAGGRSVDPAARASLYGRLDYATKLFTADGRVYASSARARPLEVDGLALFALAFALRGTTEGSPADLGRARASLRRLLMAYRDPVAGFVRSPAHPVFHDTTSARALFALARVFELDQEILA